MNGKGRLNNKTKYSYMFGDLGCCLMNYMLINYFMFYCTNMLGISIAAVGMIMFIARIWDAINDIGVGALVDRSYPYQSGKSQTVDQMVCIAMRSVMFNDVFSSCWCF